MICCLVAGFVAAINVGLDLFVEAVSDIEKVSSRQAHEFQEFRIIVHISFALPGLGSYCYYCDAKVCALSDMCKYFSSYFLKYPIFLIYVK